MMLMPGDEARDYLRFFASGQLILSDGSLYTGRALLERRLAMIAIENIRGRTPDSQRALIA
jgi:hypothetical protein